MTLNKAIDSLPAHAYADLQREATARGLSLHDYCQEVLVKASRDLQKKQSFNLNKSAIARLFGNSTAH